MSTFSLTPLAFNPSSPRVVSYMNLMVLVQKTRCNIHGKPLWRRRLETTVKYWIGQRLLWISVHWAVDKALGFRIKFKMVQVYQISNHTAFYFSWQCTPFVCPTERTMKIWTLCALVNLLFTVRHWGNILSCTKSHVPRIEHDKKGAFVICELGKRIDVLLFPLIFSKGFRGLKVRQKKWRPYRQTQIEALCKICCKALTVCSKSLPSHKMAGKRICPKSGSVKHIQVFFIEQKAAHRLRDWKWEALSTKVRFSLLKRNSCSMSAAHFRCYPWRTGRIINRKKGNQTQMNNKNLLRFLCMQSQQSVGKKWNEWTALCVVVVVPHPREEDSVYPSKSNEEKGMTTAKKRHPQHHQDMKE
jgi:hypothetical protein